MVLQPNKPTPVWVWADANEKITVQFNQPTKIVKASVIGSKNPVGQYLIKLKI